jgi:cation:H+ antiporter
LDGGRRTDIAGAVARADLRPRLVQERQRLVVGLAEERGGRRGYDPSSFGVSARGLGGVERGDRRRRISEASSPLVIVGRIPCAAQAAHDAADAAPASLRFCLWPGSRGKGTRPHPRRPSPMAFVSVGVGLVLLLVGAELLVRGAVALARRLGVSQMLIGLTVVAYGTTAPELVVSLRAALGGAPGISVGNVVGSNIANILLILGSAALICPLACRVGALRRDGPVVILAALIMATFGVAGRIDPWQGAVMLLALGMLTVISYRSERRGSAPAELHAHEAEEFADGPRSVPLMAAFVAGGVGAVVVGAHQLVEGAVELARAFGVSEAVIGLTLVAVGTSLPELATAVVAAYRGHPEVALGNVVGANTFNVLAIMGIVSLATPLVVPAQIARFDVWIMLAVTLFFVPWMMTRHRLGRPLGSAFLLAYAVYVAAQYAGLSGLQQVAG